jgi:hypothetical protein
MGQVLETGAQTAEKRQQKIPLVPTARIRRRSPPTTPTTPQPTPTTPRTTPTPPPTTPAHHPSDNPHHASDNPHHPHRATGRIAISIGLSGRWSDTRVLFNVCFFSPHPPPVQPYGRRVLPEVHPTNTHAASQLCRRTLRGGRLGLSHVTRVSHAARVQRTIKLKISCDARLNRSRLD